jgi:preprotein translocase subunit SecG
MPHRLLYRASLPCHAARFMSILISILIAFHVLVCLLMVVVVLMQRPKNEGLGAAFGGGMTENIFGAQTTHVLQKFTVWLGIVFFALTLLLAILYAKRGTGETAIQKELLSQPVPAVATSTDTAAKPEAEPSSAATPGGASSAPNQTADQGAATAITTEPVAAEASGTPAAPAPAASPSPAGN